MEDTVGRNPKCRQVVSAPGITYFKPRGVPLRELVEVYLPLDGYEALRLTDHQGLNQEAAALQMRVSRQTFGRILNEARRVVAKALLNGLALRVQGGNYALTQDEGEAAPGPGKALPPVAKEQAMNRIAVSSEGPQLDDRLDPRFGRAAGFIVVDPQTLDFEYVDNGRSQTMAQGAGIQAAEIVAAAGVKAVLTGFVGPKAFMALQAAGIQVAQNLSDLTVRQAVERFLAGEVEWAQQPNRRSHGR
jgi:predicted DNA-binding protein (UPF0251 family)/predicted Fe-Mo cluster-binding NifX family protein